MSLTAYGLQAKLDSGKLSRLAKAFEFDNQEGSQSWRFRRLAWWGVD